MINRRPHWSCITNAPHRCAIYVLSECSWLGLVLARALSPILEMGQEIFPIIPDYKYHYGGQPFDNSIQEPTPAYDLNGHHGWCIHG